MPQTIASGFQGTDCFLECLLIILADTHDLTNGSHLGTQLILDALELFKSPACKLNYNIISVRYILIQRTILTTGDVL